MMPQIGPAVSLGYAFSDGKGCRNRFAFRFGSRGSSVILLNPQGQYGK